MLLHVRFGRENRGAVAVIDARTSRAVAVPGSRRMGFSLGETFGCILGRGCSSLRA